MNISYHEDVHDPGNLDVVPHSVLTPSLQQYIIEKGGAQMHYHVKTAGIYFFVYLMNGDRVDVEY